MPIFNHGLPIRANVISGEGGVDTSQDTVTAEVLEKGYTAHDKDGNPITGTLDTEAIRAEGVEAGKKSEYDAFWDAYQNYGKTDDTGYSSERLFAFKRWTDENFYPKYDIAISSGDNYNAYYLFADSKITNLTQRLKECGVTLDTSAAKRGNEMFAWCSLLTHVPTVSFANLREACHSFARCPKLVEIEKIVFPEDRIFDRLVDMFIGCISLVNLTIEGTIGQNGFNVSWSPLSKASLTSIVNALSDTTTGLTVTLRLSAIKKAFETSEGANNGAESSEWLNLVSTKPNWTINAIDS